MMARLRLLLWKLGLGPDNCPYCGSRLIEHEGFVMHYWTCPREGCAFNAEKRPYRAR